MLCTPLCSSAHLQDAALIAASNVGLAEASGARRLKESAGGHVAAGTRVKGGRHEGTAASRLQAAGQLCSAAWRPSSAAQCEAAGHCCATATSSYKQPWCKLPSPEVARHVQGLMVAIEHVHRATLLPRLPVQLTQQQH